MGYHPGNFIGPLAFDVIFRALPHVTLDVQVGYSKESGPVRRLGIAPHLQWELWRGLRTPYLGVAFRLERVSTEGGAASSTGGCVIGGWQMRWQSGLGILVGVGVLYMSTVDLSTGPIWYHSDGGLFGTYEVGLRYFF